MKNYRLACCSLIVQTKSWATSDTAEGSSLTGEARLDSITGRGNFYLLLKLSKDLSSPSLKHNSNSS